jgi:hypothetical protein
MNTWEMRGWRKREREGGGGGLYRAHSSMTVGSLSESEFADEEEELVGCMATVTTERKWDGGVPLSPLRVRNISVDTKPGIVQNTSQFINRPAECMPQVQ